MRLVIFCLLLQGPVATSCLSSLVSPHSRAASGLVLRPCRPPVRLTMWTLGEELGMFRLRAGGHRHQTSREGSHSPVALCSQAFVWADLFSPNGQESKTLTLSFGSVLIWGLWIVSAAWPWSERGIAPDGHRGHGSGFSTCC